MLNSTGHGQPHSIPLNHLRVRTILTELKTPEPIARYAAPTDGPHGMGQPIAIAVESKGETIAGAVASIYASRDLAGIVSHGGTRTHSHWVAPDGASTAHLDRWGLKAGAVLALPRR